MSTTIIVGGGLAGLTCAFESAKYVSFFLIEKAKNGGNSDKAMSGINCAIDKSDFQTFYNDVCLSGAYNRSDGWGRLYKQRRWIRRND